MNSYEGEEKLRRGASFLYCQSTRLLAKLINSKVKIVK